MEMTGVHVAPPDFWIKCIYNVAVGVGLVTMMPKKIESTVQMEEVLPWNMCLDLGKGLNKRF